MSGFMEQSSTKRKRNAYSPNYSSDAKLWFLQNFKLEIGRKVHLTDILELHESQKDSYKFSLNDRAVGRIVRDVFGESVEIVKIRENGDRFVRVYKNIANRPKKSYAEMSSSVAKGTLIGDQWIVKDRGQCTLRIAKLSSCKYVNNVEYSPEVAFDFQAKIFLATGVNGSKCTSADLGFCFSAISWDNLEVAIDFLDSLGICTGFELMEECYVGQDGYRFQSENPLGRTVAKVVSSNCRVFSAKEGFCCGYCSNLRKNICKRYSRACEHESITRDFNGVRNDHLTREELESKSKFMKSQKRNAVRRAEYSRSKFEKESLEVESEDHLDFTKMLSAIDSEKLSPDMKMLLEQQEMALSRKTGGHRWHPRIIRMCLDVYSISPKAFDKTKEFIILPSKRLIRYYKNSIPKTSGWNSEVLLWCKDEAKRLNLKEEDLWGGLIFDEMTIQEDLQFANVGGKQKLIGGVSLGRTYADMNVLSGKDEVELATKVMQFALVTDCGFRFALAHFPVSSLTPSILAEKFWEGVEWCLKANFRIYWTLCDGGEPNRTFVKMLFGGLDPVEEKFVTYNVHTGGKLAVMIDCKHNFKKIRNNLEKSRDGKGPRQLKRNGVSITLQHWKDAYLWDLTHTLKVHHKLKEDHFNTDPRSKMRNHLAEEVLDGDMKDLMMFYRNSVGSELAQEKAKGLDEAINLVRHTSELIDLFRSKQVISSVADTRIIKAKEFIEDLQHWKDGCERPVNFFSEKLWFDLQAMVIGLEQAVDIKTSPFPSSRLKPVIINQDILENIFCQVRGSSGQNNNPNYYLYSVTMSSINMGQTVLSKKGNTGGDRSALPHASLPNLHPFAKNHQRKS